MSRTWLAVGLILITVSSFVAGQGNQTGIPVCPFYEMRVSVGNDSTLGILRSLLVHCSGPQNGIIESEDALDVQVGQHYHFRSAGKYWRSLKNFLDYHTIHYFEIVGENRTDQNTQNCKLEKFVSSATELTSPLLSPLLHVLLMVVVAVVFAA